MKKVLSLFLALVLCLGVCACSSSNSEPANEPAKIQDLDGNTVEMTAKELEDIYKENAAKFRKLYQGATVTGVGTVKRVNNFRDSFSGKTAMVYEIVMKEGWTLKVLEKGHDEVINLSSGDRIQFTSLISGADSNSVHLNRICGWPPSEDRSVIEILD